MISRRRTLGALAVLAMLPAAARAQAKGGSEDRAAVLAVVRRLFDGMRAGDSAVVRAQFHPRAILWSAAVRNGVPEARFDSLSEFARAVGTPHQEVWDERISNEVVQLDGPLATVWVDYSFYAGSRFSHCGVDAFQLARLEGGWKIVSLADTRRRDGCK
jgi:hypothetical protein